MFIDYVLTTHKVDLLRILEEPGLDNSYSINIDFLNLFEADPNTGDSVLCNPKNVIPKCDKELIEAQKRLVEKENATFSFIIKQNVYARFYGLPVCPELHRITIPKNKDLGCFLKLTGTAVRVTQARMLEYRRNYKCVKCHHIQTVEGVYEERYLIKSPNKCTNPEQNCRSHTFAPVNTVTRDNCKDYQELKIQEQVNKLTVGGIPGSMWVTLEDDLVDKCKPGDDVSICGTVLRRWNPTSSNKKCEVELVFKANHIEVCNAQKAVAVSVDPDVIKDFNDFWAKHKLCPMKGRDVILAAVCPKVYGLYMVKLALTLTVITGSSHKLDHIDFSPKKDSFNNTSIRKEDSDHNVRGQCHLLLVGDPGTGKSQLLKAGSAMLSRSVITSGSGSTKAGLTCTALREDGEWQLEAGALVLADGGACFIDELAQMREHDRASIHEAMEQQTISVAKAGIICKLNTRCSVVAACNPKGNYDTDQPLSVNVSLGTPLLSRFDLIFILLDTQNTEWDNLVSDYVLFGKTTKALPKGWPLEKLQLYMSLIGPFNVQMSQDANIILREYYVRQRNTVSRDPSRTTVRMLDSLVRLTQAHAKLMYRYETQVVDAITAVSLVDLSMQDCSLSDTSDALHTSFSFYPDLAYLKMAKKVLSSLNLYEIWHKELFRYSRMLNISRQELESNVENNVTKHFAKNVMIDDSVVDSEEVIVESSFFHQSKSNNDVIENDRSNETIACEASCSNVNKSKNIFEDANKSDDDLDAILNIDFKTSNKASTSKSGKATHEKENTNILLAQTIKKHSALHKRNIINNIGIITVKRKRSRTNNKNSKNKKAKTNKENKQISELQLVLNEINADNKKTKRKKKTDSEEKNKSTLNSNSSSDEEINDTKLFNYLPSVNDDFDIMAYTSDDDNIFQSTQNSDDKEEVINNLNDSTQARDILIIDLPKPSVSTVPSDGDRDNNKTPQKEVEVFKKPFRPIKSPVNDKTLEKLKQFSFIKNPDDYCTTILSNVPSRPSNVPSRPINKRLFDTKDMTVDLGNKQDASCYVGYEITDSKSTSDNNLHLIKNDSNKKEFEMYSGTIVDGKSSQLNNANSSVSKISLFEIKDENESNYSFDSFTNNKKSSFVDKVVESSTPSTSFSRPNVKFSSQTSIFENEDEDYESLDL